MPYEEPEKTTPAPFQSFHWGCSFESTQGVSTLCDMTQSQSDDFDWTLREGPTPSRHTGPGAATSAPYYAFIEASNPRRRNDVAK